MAAVVTLAVVGRGRLLSTLDIAAPGGGASDIPADSAPEARALLAECGDLAGQAKIDCYQDGLTLELERVVDSHPEVADCAAVGVQPTGKVPSNWCSSWSPSTAPTAGRSSSPESSDA